MPRRFFDIFKSDRRGQAGPPPTDCDSIEPLISLYSDGMTDPAETQRVEAHLAICENCRKAHYWMRATYEVISHRPAATPPVDLWSRIQDAIVDTPAAAPVPTRWRFNRRPAYALAASIALAALIVVPLAYRSNHGRTTTVALNPPSTSPVTPPVVAPSPPKPASTLIDRAPIRHAAPPQLASNAAVTHQHAAGAAITRRVIHLPKPIARVVEHNLIARSTPSTHAPAPLPSPVVNHPAERVAALTPATHQNPSTVPTRHDELPVRPTPAAATHREEQVAAATPPAEVTPPPAQPAPAAPVTHPVVAMAVHRSHGLNDDLRRVALTMSSSDIRMTRRSALVAVDYGGPTADAFNIVGAAQ